MRATKCKQYRKAAILENEGKPNRPAVRVYKNERGFIVHDPLSTKGIYRRMKKTGA